MFHDTNSDYPRQWTYAVNCSNRDECWIEGPHEPTEEAAAQRWNTRTPATWQPIKSPEYRIKSYGATAFIVGDTLSVQMDMGREQLIVLPNNIRLCRKEESST